MLDRHVQPRHRRGEIGHAPAAFPIPIGDSGAPGVRDSINQAVVVVDSPDRLIPGGGRHVMLVASVAVLVKVGVAAAAVVQE